MSVFSSREIAVAIWAGVFLFAGLLSSDVRLSFFSVARAFFRSRILVWIGLMLLYTAGMVGLLYIVNLWNVTLLKDTLLWFGLTGFVIAFSYATSRYSESIFSTIAADSFKVVIVFEFLVNTYTFPLAVELVMIPVIVVATMLYEFARRQGNEVVAKFLLAALAVTGFNILGWSLWLARSDLCSLWTIDTARAILLAPLLSVLFVPFLYLQTTLLESRRT